MSQKNETKVLVLSLLITLALVAAGASWFAGRTGLGELLSDSQSQTERPSTDANSNPTNGQAVSERFSTGEKILITEPFSPEKQAGVEAIANGNYDQAISHLESALQANRNDPEALIYLNNARIGAQGAYEIAVSTPIGNSVNSALEILRGVAQVQVEVNQAGGIKGMPLRVRIANDDNNPETARQVAEALVADPLVLGVIGHFGSDVTLAAAPVYSQGNLVMISPTSTSTQLSGLSNYVFRTVPSDRFTATALARYMLTRAQKQNVVIFFNSGSDYSKSLKDEFTTALLSDGGQILTEFDLASPNFNAGNSVEQAIQQGAEVLMLAANTATLDQALQVVTVTRGRLELLGGDSIYNPKTLQIGGEAANGMVVAVPWHILSDPQSEFAQISRQLWGGDVNWRTATSYDAAIALVTALEQNPTREGVERALKSRSFSAPGATGTVRFLPSGDRSQASQLVVVEAGSRSGYGYDFVPVQEP